MTFRTWNSTVHLLFHVLLLSIAISVAAGASTPVKTFQSKADFEEQVLQSDGIWMIHVGSTTPGTQVLQAAVEAVSVTAILTKGIIQVGVVDTETPKGREIATDFHLKSGGESPALLIFSQEKTKPTEYRGKIEPEAMIQSLMDEIIKVIQGRASSGNYFSSSGSSSRGNKKEKLKSKKEKNRIVQGTLANYDEYVLNNPDVVLVAFTAPWCGYCKKLEPEWQEAASRLDGEGVTLVNVDATVEQQLAGLYGVSGYPTIKYFPGGPNKSHEMAKDLPVERDAGPIVDFALKLVDQTGVPHPIKELVSQSVLEDTCVGHNQICVLVVLPHILESSAATRNKYREMVARVQKSFRSGGAYKFLWMEGGAAQLELESALELTFGFPAVVALSLERQAYSVLRGSFSEKSITSFLHGVTTGRQPTVKLQRELPAVVTVEPWDGQDGAPIEEEELSLEEIMGWGDEAEL